MPAPKIALALSLLATVIPFTGALADRSLCDDAGRLLTALAGRHGDLEWPEGIAKELASSGYAPVSPAQTKPLAIENLIAKKSDLQESIEGTFPISIGPDGSLPTSDLTTYEAKYLGGDLTVLVSPRRFDCMPSKAIFQPPGETGYLEFDLEQFCPTNYFEILSRRNALWALFDTTRTLQVRGADIVEVERVSAVGFVPQDKRTTTIDDLPRCSLSSGLHHPVSVKAAKPTNVAPDLSALNAYLSGADKIVLSEVAFASFASLLGLDKWIDERALNSPDAGTWISLALDRQQAKEKPSRYAPTQYERDLGSALYATFESSEPEGGQGSFQPGNYPAPTGNLRVTLGKEIYVCSSASLSGAAPGSAVLRCSSIAVWSAKNKVPTFIDIHVDIESDGARDRPTVINKWPKR